MRPGGDRWSHTPDRINNWQDHRDWQNNRWDHINNDWRDNWNDYRDHFDGDWCHHHPFWNCDGDFNYWAFATWGVAASWLPWGWTEPQYYNYGQNVYYEDDTVYYGSTPVASAAEYTAQAEAIATSVPETPPADDSWMSLGVFGITADAEQSSAAPTMYLQLVISREGVIAGTLQNTVSGTTKSIEGMVDKASYRAAWTVVGEKRPLMESGFSNLTDKTVPVLVHYEDGTTQQWLLVRMEAPPETSSEAPPKSPPSATPPQ